MTFRDLFKGKEGWWSHTCSFTARVREKLTDKQYNATASVTARRQSLEIKFEEIHGAFKPGLPYYLKIKLDHSDGNPVALRFQKQKHKYMQITLTLDGNVQYRNISLDEFTDDVFETTFLTDSYVRNMQIVARLDKYTESHYRSANDQADGLYLQVVPESKQVEVDGKLKFDLQWTKADVSRIRYLVSLPI